MEAAEGEVFVKEDVALHVTLGDTAKDEETPTVSRQVQVLRSLIADPPNEDWKQVADGSLILAVHAESAVSKNQENRLTSGPNRSNHLDQTRFPNRRGDHRRDRSPPRRRTARS